MSSDAGVDSTNLGKLFAQELPRVQSEIASFFIEKVWAQNVC